MSFNFQTFQYIISAMLLKVKVKEVFSYRKETSESIWSTLYFACQFCILEIKPNSNLILKWHRKCFCFILLFLFVCLIPSSVWKKIWRQTQRFFVLAYNHVQFWYLWFVIHFNKLVCYMMTFMGLWILQIPGLGWALHCTYLILGP